MDDLSQPGLAERIKFEVRRRRNHPAVIAAGLPGVLDTLANWVDETETRLRALESAVDKLPGDPE